MRTIESPNANALLEQPTTFSLERTGSGEYAHPQALPINVPAAYVLKHLGVAIRVANQNQKLLVMDQR